MNAIIVGKDGRPSILAMLKTFNFENAPCVFTYKTDKDGNRKWYQYNSDKPEKAISLKEQPFFTLGDIVIFWGTRVPLQTKGAIVYNPIQVLNNASNKGLARQMFDEAGIPIPMLIEKNELDAVNYPVIIRKNHHRAGIGFFTPSNKKEAIDTIEKKFGDHDYYISEVYPKTEEYRVHCASGKALLVKRKPTPEDKSIIAWNFHQLEAPWTTIERKNYDHKMVTLALKAVETLGLDFGAVDIMCKPSIKGLPPYVVAEINTAPSYTPYLISKYGAYFDLAFSCEKGKMKPWDYKKFKKGDSLAWKNSQLNEIR